ncbi:MAG: hypothetical protein LBE36_12890 [Flavobacteriaceae bacterium]|nr:hypothetical protein [Flavobacteriaceae bacterium]
MKKPKLANKIYYKMKAFILLFFLLIPINYFSQGIALNIGYQYVGRSAGFAGLDYRLSERSSEALNVGAGTYLTTINKKFTAIPEFHINYSFEEFFLTELSVSTKNFKPSIGINALNLMQMKFGYGFNLGKEKHLNGFFFGINFFLGENGFYDTLNVIR